MIEVGGLTFEYSGHRALDGVGFTVRTGSCSALVGPNGAGKTTLLRCLAALERPVAGRIEIDGIDVLSEPRKVHRRLGYLYDSFGLYDDMTVEQCLRHRAAMLGVSGAARPAALEAVLQRLALTKLRHAAAGRLSRGQRQKLGIAHAILHEPSTILLDEPASGLDPEARFELSEILRDLRASGVTLIVSSHILTELTEYCTDALVLRDGRVTEQYSLTADETSEVELVTIGFAAEPEGLAATIAEVTGSTLVEQRELEAEVRIAGGPESRRLLLAALVTAGHPVVAFAPRKESLSARYFAESGRTP